MEEQLTSSQIGRRLAQGWLVYAFVFSVYILGPTAVLVGLYGGHASPQKWDLTVLSIMLSYNMIVESKHLYSHFCGRFSRSLERTISGDMIILGLSAIMILGPVLMMPSWPVVVRCMAACWLFSIGVLILPERPRLEEGCDGDLFLIQPNLWSHDTVFADDE